MTSCHCDFRTELPQRSAWMKMYSYIKREDVGLKGKVHPKVKFRSSSAHLPADGELSDVLLSTERFWIFTAEQRCSILLHD